MFWIIWAILLILWILALASGYTMGGFVHILVVIAVILLAIRLIQGRKIF
ncbi:MAG: lmo0937 family membrane protein [Desulfobacterales bacterium]|nr:lmo0937 family membrane protein [Desulfobacterales bacterium]